MWPERRCALPRTPRGYGGQVAGDPGRTGPPTPKGYGGQGRLKAKGKNKEEDPGRRSQTCLSWAYSYPRVIHGSKGSPQGWLISVTPTAYGVLFGGCAGGFVAVKAIRKEMTRLQFFWNCSKSFSRSAGGPPKIGFRFVMKKYFLVLVGVLFVAANLLSQPASPPVRIAIVGLVHDHAWGFIPRFNGRTDVQLAGIVETNQDLIQRYSRAFHLDPDLFYPSLERIVRQDERSGGRHFYQHPGPYARGQNLRRARRGRDDGKADGHEHERSPRDRGRR